MLMLMYLLISWFVNNDKVTPSQVVGLATAETLICQGQLDTI